MNMDDWVECNECHKKLPVTCFYTHWGTSQTCKDKRQKYLKINHTCKKCRAKIRQQKIDGIRDQILQQRIEEQVTSYEPKMVLGWVVRNLKRFGNCYVRRLGRIDIQATAQAIGAPIRIIQVQEDGYILEKKKRGKKNEKN